MTLKEILDLSITYDEYIRNVSAMVREKATSGLNQSESMVNYTYLNFKRMTRLNKTIVPDAQLIDAVEASKKSMVWVAITEAWCGDAAQNLPYIAKIASAANNVDFEVVYRDETPGLIEKYLTNGARSIPKLVGFDRQTEMELFVWGPRPKPVQQMVMSYKEKLDHEKLPFDKFTEEIHRWYAKDKNATLKTELLHIFRPLD